MRHVRPYVHQMGDAVTALAFGVTLEEFANLEEKHHEDSLWILRLGSGEKTYQQGTDSSDGHEEVLIEGVAVGDTLPGLVECLVAY